MHRESLFDIIFLMNEEKEFRKNVKQTLLKKYQCSAQILCAVEVLTHLKLMVNDLRSNYFW